ncbi:MAG TPA: monovalent cation/H(+) antiporter subunit G [Ilumatobacter sp.]|nr:monovalent cation/H(+) antiporter subunit G [Ilumatobacter sp.]
MMDGFAAAFLTAGALLTLLAGIGVVRFPDVTSRMHAAAKAPVLGIMLCGIGVAFAVQTVETTIIVALVIVLQLITSPVGSHLLARSIYHQLHPHIDGVDELAAADEDPPETV